MLLTKPLQILNSIYFMPSYTLNSNWAAKSGKMVHGTSPLKKIHAAWPAIPTEFPGTSIPDENAIPTYKSDHPNMSELNVPSHRGEV